jgi:sugar phosphate isomerase/epimerase
VPEVSLFGFEAWAAAGYRGIGLIHADIRHLRDTLGFGRMRAILAASGLRDVEVEIFSDWFATGERRARSDRIRADLLVAAQELGAAHIKVCGDLTGAQWPLPVLADAFGGLLLDIWHMVRGRVPFDHIGRLPGDRSVSVEVDNGPAEPCPDLWQETLHERTLCGERAFDIRGFVAQVDKTGYQGPIGIEILSRQHRKLPLRGMATRAITSLRKVPT